MVLHTRALDAHAPSITALFLITSEMTLKVFSGGFNLSEAVTDYVASSTSKICSESNISE